VLGLYVHAWIYYINAAYGVGSIRVSRAEASSICGAYQDGRDGMAGGGSLALARGRPEQRARAPPTQCSLLLQSGRACPCRAATREWNGTALLALARQGARGPHHRAGRKQTKLPIRVDPAINPRDGGPQRRRPLLCFASSLRTSVSNSFYCIYHAAPPPPSPPNPATLQLTNPTHDTPTHTTGSRAKRPSPRSPLLYKPASPPFFSHHHHVSPSSATSRDALLLLVASGRAE
jgi:hypothetical protein